MKRIPTMLIGLALALAATACGSDDGTASTEPPGAESQGTESVSTDSSVAAPTVTSTTDDTADTAAALSLSVAETDVGSVLVDADGNAVYLFTNDADGPTCNDECADAWPPVPAPVSAGDGANPELIGAVTRADGTEQATYAGWPVYYYAGDTAAGETNGQGVGGVWFVVDATGNGIGAPLDDGY